MDAELIRFGLVEIDGERYDYDVVIDAGVVGKRKKKPSKRYRPEYGHTPLSADEALPWGGAQLIIGTGTYGDLPITPTVREEADRRGVELVVLPTEEACGLIRARKRGKVYAVLHVTC